MNWLYKIYDIFIRKICIYGIFVVSLYQQIKRKDMEKTITVRFKETYMSKPVERTCTNMTRQEIMVSKKKT